MATSIIICCIALMLTCVNVEGKIEMNLQDVLRLKEYDGALRPQQSGVTRVNVSMVINSILVDETRQVLEVSGMLIQEWNDNSLSFLGTSEALLPSITLAGPAGAAIRNQVWCPDLTAGRQARPTTQDAEFIRIDRHGHVTWSQRVHYDFPCKMDLSSYPLSEHKCTLILTSLGYEESELDPAWQGNPPLDYRNVVLSHGFKLTKVVTIADTVYYVHRPKRELHVVMTVSPRSGWAIKHTVIPMLATVTTAYLTFFINIRGACARMLTIMLSMVTAAIFHESAYSKVPPAHETMAIEVFTGTCLTFIFIAALETVIVEVLSSPKSKSRRSATSPRNSFALEVRDLKPDLTEDRSGGRGQVAAVWLDRCFRVLYPAGFLAFNAVYWIIYA